MKDALWVAGALQFVVALAHLPAHRILALDREVAALPTTIRQIYRMQHAYILGLLVFFAGISPLLAVSGPLSVALSSMLALFWGTRLAAQRLYFDSALLRLHRAADLFYTLCFAALTAIFATAAIGGLR